MRRPIFCLGLLSLVLCWAASTWADEPVPAADEPPVPVPVKHLLRYKFQPGETLRWRVEHHSHIRTTISGTTQTAESDSHSVKVWKVTGTDDQGNITFEHSVESVRMRQKHSGRQEVTYDSLVDTVPPPVFEEAARSVGVPLTIVTMDPLGKVVHRDEKQPRAPGSEDSQLTISLPEQPVGVGDTWSFPNEIEVTIPDQGPKRIKLRNQYTLKEVAHGVAVIHMETVVLTPVRDPAIQAQLVQRETTGEVRFDIEAGRIISQQIDLDKNVVGFAGEQSSLHCRTHFEEAFVSEPPATARAEEDPAP